MPAYIVFTREEILDENELSVYSRFVAGSFEGHDVTFLAAYGDIEQLEGAPVDAGVILRFPDIPAARAWYYSDAYQEVAVHRFKGARFRAFIINGLD